MKYIHITNQTHPEARAILAKYCDSFLCQLRGLMFTKNLPDQQGLLLVQKADSRIDASIHMMFMWMDLAVIWIDSRYRVVDTVLARRWKLAYLPKQPAKFVLEAPVSCLPDYIVGDQLIFNEMDS
jgi:uncharacterized membrane protein (UPF0127 family)